MRLHWPALIRSTLGRAAAAPVRLPAPNFLTPARGNANAGGQDEAIAFYTSTLGFSLVADVPFGEGERWVEVAPPGGGTAIALVPPRGDYRPGRMTGIALESADPRADHAELKETGVDVDAELMGGDGTVPLLSFFRDHDENHLMIVQGQ